ncbi:MAG TPA: hypothetical protein VMS21_00335 [Methylomirabilota bacterium]|nr:hypothetical protein [Methylomirabilota bacterium]
MSQAAAALRVPLARLRAAKADGCAAFRSGRVYAEPLRAWLRAHPPKPAKRSRPHHVAKVAGLADAAGLEGSLLRLARAEREAHDAHLTAPDDPAKFRRWQVLAEALRRTDSALVEARKNRGEGEFLSRDDAANLFARHAAYLRAAVNELAEEIGRRFFPDGGPQRGDLIVGIRTAFWRLLEKSNVTAGASFPEWVGKAFTGASKRDLRPWEVELREVVSAGVAASCAEDFSAAIVEREAKRAREAGYLAALNAPSDPPKK